jgi:hypothetical protein
MQRFDHPSQPIDPYPDPGTRVTALKYDSALVLARLRDAPKMRNGEDADYLTFRPYSVTWKSESGDWRQITVPEGFITDLTSVPRPLRWIAGRVGPWLEAAIVHDYLYVAWQDVPGKSPLREDRRFADDIMLAAMREAEVHPWMAWAIHRAVSLFGGRTYAGRNPERYVLLDDPALDDQFDFRIPRVV